MPIYSVRGGILRPSTNKKNSVSSTSNTILTDAKVDFVSPEPLQMQEKQGNGLSNLSQRLSNLEIKSHGIKNDLNDVPGKRKKNISFIL